MSKPSKDEIQKFSSMIEEMASNLRSTRLEAILQYCDKSGFEIEVASTLLSSALKSRIQEECEHENLIKRTSKLPI
jgi:Phage late-transcription coactivator